MIWRKSIGSRVPPIADGVRFAQGSGEEGSGMGAEGEANLERDLSELLSVERFEPPAEFREWALLGDPAVYDEAAADPEGWWLRQATELLDWTRPPSEALDESNPPFCKWFADGRLNASAN